MTGLHITHPGFSRLLRVLLRWAHWIAALVAMVYFCNYLLDAHTRTTRAPSCEWDPVPNPFNVAYEKAYTARFCYLARHVFLLQIHHADGTLVAERTYDDSAFPSTYWKSNGVDYTYSGSDGSAAGGFIDIPPTLIDRLLAKLP